MPTEQNGGLWSLGGYLYQTIGILGLGARISRTENLASSAKDDFDLFIQLESVRKASQIHPEAFNEDALILTHLDGEDEGVFIQFKYSAKASPPPIGPKAVQEIISTFDASVTQAETTGVRITTCVLITNRRFAEGKDSGGQKWQDEENLLRKYKLRKIVGISAQSFYEALHKFGQRYGALEEEIEKGINSLIGQEIRQSAGEFISPDSFKKRLIQAFTGSAEATPLSASDLQSKCQRHLGAYAENLRIDDWDSMPVRRHAYRDLFTLIRTRALIGLQGPGGCGKSVLLWQLLTGDLKSVCTVYPASQVYSDWLSERINQEYRGLPPGHPNDSIAQAVQRVLTANGDLPKPVLLLGLDGLDEITHPDQKQVIQKAVRWFWERDRGGGNSEAVLITTYRRPEQLGDLLEFSYDYSGPKPATVELGEFNDEELEEALEKAGYPQSQYLIEGFPSHDPYPLEGGSDRSAFSHIASSVLPALCHPVIWRSLMRLRTPEREGVFHGDQAALDQLASGYIKWFSEKLRRKDILDLGEERLHQLLGTIARQTSMGASYSIKDHWVAPATECCGSQNRAQSILNEAELTGLIQRMSYKEWRWKHAFVYDFLKRQD